MRTGPGSHALVIGASVTGLCAARVLRSHFDRVTIVERDRLEDGPAFRSGVPHSRHLHLLLGKGRQLLEVLFPELPAAFECSKVPLINLTRDLEMFTFVGMVPRYRSVHETRACSRLWLESTLRAMLRVQPGIELVDQAEVAALLESPRGVVSAVELRRRSGPRELVSADLVVDATGRNSKALDWLAALNYPTPSIETVNAHLGYASRWYEKPRRASEPWLGVYTGLEPIRNSRIGVLFPVEGERWVLTLAGMGQEQPPTDEQGFLQFTRRLARPTIYETLPALRPISPIYGYRATENRWIHFERMDRWPDGFVAMGDAVCCFNPVYGQGISVAALEAVLLSRLLEDRGSTLRGFARRFQRKLPSVLETAWVMSTGEDLRWPATEGGTRSVAKRLTHWYLDQFVRDMCESREMIETFIAVQHLMVPPTALLHPSIVARLTARAVRTRLDRELGTVEPI
ncbi:MAG TPA: FAD-dependent monooxygenase [Polyangiales bacterium]|nr:FAD-dependent monooxygenase [Polyangiales bacterium]